jgi:DNA-binding NarL/FixJ family response regulator
VRAGAARFVHVSGEPGIGKTRLLGELCERARAAGADVREGAAAEFEVDAPFGAWLDAFGDQLAELLPGTAGHGPGERWRVHRAVRARLAALAGTRPLVVALDDLHWADAATLELLAALRRRLPAAPVLLATASREPGPADVRIELAPLGPDEARALLGGAAAPAVLEAGGGNPFLLLELARAPAGELPRGVAETTGEELRRLPAPARRLAEGAAVAGDPFDLDLAAAAAPLTTEVALDALDALDAAGLVRAAGLPRRFRFRHPLVRRAVREAMAPGARIAAHERCARALGERGAPPAALAHHVEHAARPGDREAVRVLRRAGEASAGQAPASAARWFAVALELLPVEGAEPERLALLVDLAGAHAATGDFEAGRTALEAALALVPGPDTATRARLIAACAGVEQLLGRHDEADRRLRRALRDRDALDPEAAVGLLLQLAAGDFYRMDYRGMREWGSRAAEVAQAAGDRPLVAAATAVLAVADAFVGAIASAQAHRLRAGALADALSDAEAARRLDGLAHLATAELYLHRYADAGRHAERGLALARATGQGDVSPVLVPVLATALHMRGEIPAAAELLDGAVEAARLSGNAQELGWSLLSRSFVAVAAGDLELALSLAEESLASTRGIDDSLVRAYGSLALADARCQSGDPDGAIDTLLTGAGGTGLSLVAGGWRASYFELLTRCRLAQGRPREAARTARMAAAVAERSELPLAASMARRAEASVALARGDPARAAELAFAGMEAAAASEARVDAARAQALAGEALAAAGERARGMEELEAAARTFRACGARGYRQGAEASLRRLGRRFHRPASPAETDGAGVKTLTGRELEVAALVLDRRTNPEIAARLFLSVKTIETHMRNIFRKLDVSSRADVARALERARRVP